VKFYMRWRTAIAIALTGTAITGSVTASVGTGRLTTSSQAPAAEHVTIVDAAMPGRVRLSDRTSDAAKSTQAVWPDRPARNGGWWRSRTAIVKPGGTATVVIAAGARIRIRPVNGPVIGLISRGDWFFVQCQRRAGDGYVWGYGQNNGRWGWVREDLWDVIYSTAPGAPASRPIPWC
jgi:hypothetical protein